MAEIGSAASIVDRSDEFQLEDVLFRLVDDRQMIGDEPAKLLEDDFQWTWGGHALFGEQFG